MPQVYPLMGEFKRPQSNARRYYRNGDACLWCRYIIGPREDGILSYGWTVGDTVVSLVSAGLFMALASQVGNALDGWLRYI